MEFVRQFIRPEFSHLDQILWVFLINMTLLSRLHYAVNIYRVPQKFAYYFCKNYTKSCCMSIKFGAWLVHSICSTKVRQLHNLPAWCFYTTLYDVPMHQRSCSIMSSFDYGQPALLRFVVEQVVQQIHNKSTWWRLTFAALTSTAILCYSA